MSSGDKHISHCAKQEKYKTIRYGDTDNSAEKNFELLKDMLIFTIFYWHLFLPYGIKIRRKPA